MPMTAAEPVHPVAGPADRYPVPNYVPAEVRPVLPWTRRHVERVTARYQASRGDLWDEALTALIRAAVYFKPQDPAAYRSTQYSKPLPAARSFRYYAQLAVNRACWRYVIRGQATQVRTIPLELDNTALPEHHRVPAGLPDALLAPSAEDEAIARDASRRAWVLRAHAALAAAHGDDDTTSRLRAAASAADRVGRRPRRRSPSSRSA
jgi:hypothetical protein